MDIITHQKTFNTDKEPVILVFKTDDELSDFIRLLISTKPVSKGMRIIPLIDESKLDEIQRQVLNIVKLLDGVNVEGTKGDGKNDSVDAAIDAINALLGKH